MSKRFQAVLLASAALVGSVSTACSSDSGTKTLAWTLAEPISVYTGTVRSPAVGIDAEGNAIAVWDHQDGGDYQALYATYASAAGWGLGQALSSDAIPYAAYPQIAMNAAGQALVVWYQEADGEPSRVWARFYRPGAGWGLPELLDTVDDASFYRNAFYANVAINERGDGIATWKQERLGGTDLVGRSFSVASGWRPAAVYRAPCCSGSGYPETVAIDGEGNALTFWVDIDDSIWAARYDALGDSWSAAERLDSQSGPASTGTITMNAAGSALATWEQSDGSTYLVWAARFVPGTGWQPPEVVSSSTIPQGHGVGALDAEGNAMVLWQQIEATGIQVFARRRLASGSWEPAERIDRDVAGEASEPIVAGNAAGELVAAWVRDPGADPRSIEGARYSPSTGWSAAVALSTGAVDAIAPAAAVAPDGRAVVVWEEYDAGRGTVWGTRLAWE